MRKPRKTPKLKGEHARPIYCRAFTKEEDNRILRIQNEKLGLLLQSYDIDANDSDRWRLLSLALACDHERGFQVTTELLKPVGHPMKWTHTRQFQLVYAVNMALGPSSKERGVRRLKMKEVVPTIIGSFPEIKKASLEPRYYDARRKLKTDMPKASTVLRLSSDLKKLFPNLSSFLEAGASSVFGPKADKN